MANRTTSLTTPERPGSAASLFRGRDLTYVIIGASGWLGRAALDLLEGEFGADIPRRIRAFGSSSRLLRLRSGLEVRIDPLAALADLPRDRRYLFLHFAFITRDKVASTDLATFVAGNEAIRRGVIAAAERLDVAGLFVPSSGAVFGIDRTIETDISRNPYGAMKLQDEEAFALLAWRRGFPVTIARVFNLAGPHINKLDTYALSSIILAALNGGPIELRARRRVIRSYADVRDVLSVGLASLADNERPPVVLFETAGETEIEIGALARLAAKTIAGAELTIIRPPMADESVDRYVGDGEQYRALASRYGIRLRPLAEQVADTAAYLRAVISGEPDEAGQQGNWRA